MPRSRSINTNQNGTNINSKRITYFISGAFVFGILGYYYYTRTQAIPNTKGQKKIMNTVKLKESETHCKSVQIETKIWKIKTNDTLSFDDYVNNESIVAAGRALKAGHLIAFPTETVYGLGCNALSNTASCKIFVAKGRPSDNPLIVHISQVSQLYEWILDPIECTAIHPLISKLISIYWPGPLSIVFPYVCNYNNVCNAKLICDCVRGGGRLQSVAVRMPSNNIARALISCAQCPIAAPSANISGRPSPTQSKHVVNDLNGKIYAILDCGDIVCDVGLESTVIKMDEINNRIVILRPGGVTRNMMLDVIGNEMDIVYSKDIDIHHNVEAPGMKYRHYAPKKPLYLVDDMDLFPDIYWFYKLKNELHSVVFIVTKQNRLSVKCEGNNSNVIIIGDDNNLNQIAANLFSVLRTIDDEKQYKDIKLIFSQVFDKNDIGVAIMNRLDKASQSNKIITNLTDLQAINL